MFILLAVLVIIIIGGVYKLCTSKSKPFLGKHNRATDHALKVTHLRIVSKSQGCHVIQFTCALPGGYHLGLPVGKHIKLKAPVDFEFKRKTVGEWNGHPDDESTESGISRKYTPVSESDSKDMQLLVKIYEDSTVDKFPDGGKMSQYLNTVKLGDILNFSGPYGMHEYVSPGVFQSGARRVDGIKHIGLIGAGSGITPLYSLINEVLNNPNDTDTKLWLIYANRFEEEILLRDDLDFLALLHKDRFRVWYTLDAPPPDSWEYSTGFVNKEMIDSHMPKPGPDTIAAICGPPGFCKFACKNNLETLEWDPKLVIEF